MHTGNWQNTNSNRLPHEMLSTCAVTRATQEDRRGTGPMGQAVAGKDKVEGEPEIGLRKRQIEIK